MAQALQTRVAAEHTAQQERFHFWADRFHQTFQSPASKRPIATSCPVTKQGLGGAHQVMAQPFDLRVFVIDEGLKVAFQMGPAPLQPRPQCQYILARSQWTSPQNASPSSSCSTDDTDIPSRAA